MSQRCQPRRVLLAEDQPSIRSILCVRLAALGCERDAVPHGQQALARIRQEEFDAVLLDLRCSNVNAKNVIPEIKEIRPSLVGRLLLITGEAADAVTLDLIERYCLQHVSPQRIQQDLLDQLRVLLKIFPSATETS
jgi:DNA-binding response OmpR family regulator